MHKQLPLLIGSLVLAFGNFAFARQDEAPFSVGPMAKRTGPPAEVRLPAIDAAALRLQNDASREKSGMPHTKRLMVAQDNPVAFDTLRYGEWRTRPDGSLMWRMRVHVPGATDLHLGFENYQLVPGAALWVVGAGDYFEGPYTSDDQGPLWIPVVPGDGATIELQLPVGADIDDVGLTLTNVGAGSATCSGERAHAHRAVGPCNIHVVCPLGQPIRRSGARSPTTNSEPIQGVHTSARPR